MYAKTLKKLKIKRRKKQKSSYYKAEELIKAVKGQYRWLVRYFRDIEFVLDDEKYFTLSNFNISRNNGFYSSDHSSTPPEVKFRFKKFEPKIIFYIVISSKGISKPFFRKSGLAVTKEVYIEKCLKK